MCGIAGFIDFRKNTSFETLEDMISAIRHRGPDDYGTEILDSPFASIGLGQARLSIIDLSPGGHQPMHFRNLSIVFNGEIYNFNEIKADLSCKGHKFTTHSDTEVLLHAWDEWGAASIQHFIGMFAFVIYDHVNFNLYLVRDRAGVKPLFYYIKSNILLFASELKAFHSHKEFIKSIDLKSLPDYFNYGYIAAPHTIFENTYKLLPGHLLTINLKSQVVSNDSYWKVEKFYTQPKLRISYEEAKDELHKLLISACNYRMVADVPVGVFLSGGYDSTLISSIIQRHQKNKLKTFTIGFEEGNNEAPYAKQTANYLGTDHLEYICTSKEAQDIIPDLPFFFDEPFADSSAIPTILVSRLARNHVTVALSADAGDEIFAGYNSYRVLESYQRKLSRIPNLIKPLKNVLVPIIDRIPFHESSLKHRFQGALKSINENPLIEAANLFRYMSSLPESYHNSLFKTKIIPHQSSYEINIKGFHNPIEVAMAIDFKNYLQNDILTKVDRSSMSTSLEGREPLLDHRLIEYAAQLPLEFKLNQLSGKRILKDIAYEYIPISMLERPKTGFSLPIYTWLRGDLSFLVDEFLNTRELSKSGIFNVLWVMKQVDLFKKRQLHYSPLIWKLLMFQMWYKKWIE